MSITLKDIAQQAGVSQMTVSRILNGKTQGQVSQPDRQKTELSFESGCAGCGTPESHGADTGA